MNMDRDSLLQQLVERLQAALGDRLVSVVLFGSAASGDADDASDLNILCVIETIGRQQLESVHPAVAWWLKKKQPAPVFLSREELVRARDAFSIELFDIRRAYRMLAGEDVVEGIRIEPSQHRFQVEHELRARLVRLRASYLMVQKDRSEIVRLLCDSLPTFATLLRHAVVLAGGEAKMKKREAFKAAGEHLGLDPAPFESVMACREGMRLADGEIRNLFDAYLGEIDKAARFVDQLDKESAGGAAS